MPSVSVPAATGSGVILGPVGPALPHGRKRVSRMSEARSAIPSAASGRLGASPRKTSTPHLRHAGAGPQGHSLLAGGGSTPPGLPRGETADAYGSSPSSGPAPASAGVETRSATSGRSQAGQPGDDASLCAAEGISWPPPSPGDRMTAATEWEHARQVERGESPSVIWNATPAAPPPPVQEASPSHRRPTGSTSSIVPARATASSPTQAREDRSRARRGPGLGTARGAIGSIRLLRPARPPPIRPSINLSGLSMEGVNVHYNSLTHPSTQRPSPTHRAETSTSRSGQVRHLPHEAWHIVQQAQGRVSPTSRTRGGFRVNDEAELEREADEMGERASESNGRHPATEVAGSRLVDLEATRPRGRRTDAGPIIRESPRAIRRDETGMEPVSNPAGPTIQCKVAHSSP